MGDKFIIELDEATYCLDGSTLNLSPHDFQSINGYGFLISDFSNSFVTGVMNVDANIKYAEAIVARNLRDDGEFDEPVSVIPHWKQKKGKKSTDIFFTAIPSKIYHRYIDRINQHEDLLTLVPVFSVLGKFLQRIARKDSVAVVFFHSRFADIVIGKKDCFYHAVRCVAFEGGDNRSFNLWNIVGQEISNLEREKSIKIQRVISLNWIDTEHVVYDMSNCGAECFVFNEEPVEFDGGIRNISFLRVVRMCSVFKDTGLHLHTGGLLYLSDRLFIPAMMVIVLFTCAMISGYFLYNSETAKLKRDIVSTMSGIRHMRETALTSVPENKDYLDVIKFVDSLLYIRKVPSYRKVVNDISSSIYASIIINDLKIDYTQRTMQAELSGTVNSSFDKAYRDYRLFLSNLREKGYFIDKSGFDTEIERSEFMLKFSWKMR